MPTRNANAVWKGGLKDGSGQVALGSGAFSGPYSFASRFEQAGGTNPEELIGAAHAGCYSMALSGALEKAGHRADEVKTKADVTLDMVDGAATITGIHLTCEATVPGIDDAAFQEQAEGAKQNCPVSKALAGTEITLDAKLV